MTTTMHLARAYAALKELFALIGFAAVAAGLLLAVQRDDMLSKLAAIVAEPLAVASVAGDAAIQAAAAAIQPLAAPVQPSPAHVEQEREQRAVTAFIARRYRVSESAVAGFVSAAYRAGEEHSVDPLLILAVMAVESRYNPVAKSGMGAKGLMQVIPKWHPEKLVDHGGEEALLEPDVNIAVGTQILREYMRRFGDTEAALQMYAGAFDEPTSQYANKVLAEKARLETLRRKTKSAQSA